MNIVIVYDTSKSDCYIYVYVINLNDKTSVENSEKRLTTFFLSVGTLSKF